MKPDQALFCLKPHMIMTLCLFHANIYRVQDKWVFPYLYMMSCRPVQSLGLQTPVTLLMDKARKDFTS